MKRIISRKKVVNNKRRIIFYAIFFLVFFISIGYAYMSTSLSITGHTAVKGNTWDIHFENLSITNGSVTATTPAAINGNSTTINYDVNLGADGDFYEFSVDVVNAGTIPGKVSGVSITGLSNGVGSIKYITGEDVGVDDILNSNSRKRIKVRVTYPTGYSGNLSLNLTFNINYGLTNEEEITISSILQELMETQGNFVQYEGNVTDSVGVTTTASNVYFDINNDYRNIIFGGFCWQMIRTTENGGIKVVYNGEPVNDKCENTRGTHKGIVGTVGAVLDLSGTYLYGSSFSYDINSSSFTISNTETGTLNTSNFENFIGKYTCKTNGTTCTTLYNINGYSGNTNVYASAFTIGDVHYASIGSVPFNASYFSPSSVGYMFYYTYNRAITNPSNSTYKFGSSFTYDSNNGTYTLSGTTQNISNWSTGYSQINNTRYTCWNATGTCSNVFYVFGTDDSQALSLVSENGYTVSDMITQMLSSNSVNHHDSTIKGVIDTWYRQNLVSYTSILEDAVYCNARNIVDYGGFDPSGSTTTDYDLKYKNRNLSYTLDCPNITDQFSLSNNKAQLTYPVALLTHEELAIYGNSEAANQFRSVNAWYWDLSPNSSHNSNTIRGVEDNGSVGGYHYTGYSALARPAITLKSSTKITSGSGSETDPWVVDDQM